MRKKLPPSALAFIEQIKAEAEPAEFLNDVRGVFLGNSSIPRWKIDQWLTFKATHVFVFCALAELDGLHQSEARELYKSLPPDRQERLDRVIKLAIAAALHSRSNLAT